MSRILLAAAALLLLTACARADDSPPASVDMESGRNAISEESHIPPEPEEFSALPGADSEGSMHVYESVPDEESAIPSALPASENPPAEPHLLPAPDNTPAEIAKVESFTPENTDAEQISPPFEADMSLRIEDELLHLINDERRKNSLEALGVEADMQIAAGIRAAEALEHLSHTRPDGLPYHTAFDEAGFQYAGKWHGENLAFIHTSAYDEAAVAAALFSEWNSSPGHRQNILGENFIQTGLSIYIRQNGDMVEIGAAQLFASL